MKLIFNSTTPHEGFMLARLLRASLSVSAMCSLPRCGSGSVKKRFELTVKNVPSHAEHDMRLFCQYLYDPMSPIQSVEAQEIFQRLDAVIFNEKVKS